MAHDKGLPIIWSRKAEIDYSNMDRKIFGTKSFGVLQKFSNLQFTVD